MVAALAMHSRQEPLLKGLIPQAPTSLHRLPVGLRAFLLLPFLHAPAEVPPPGVAILGNGPLTQQPVGAQRKVSSLSALAGSWATGRSLRHPFVFDHGSPSTELSRPFKVRA